MAVDIPMNLEQVQAYYDRPAIVRSADDPQYGHGRKQTKL